MTDQINVSVNGDSRQLDRGKTVRDLVEEIGLDPQLVAVERNRSIVKRERFGEVTLDDGDQIEIVQFVGGG